MNMFTKLFNLNKRGQKKILNRSCYFCKKKSSDLRNYVDFSNQKIKVCSLCVEYAERRAYRKWDK